ncbi:MAG: HlyC/CorC family transporter [Hyphomicrobiales bacterium]|nr:HlyC/CorC family transporter [Hyphomicrobiales bacterium]
MRNAGWRSPALPETVLAHVNLWLSSLPVSLAVIVLCVLLSMFFSASETALTAASKARFYSLEKSGDARATRVNRLIGDMPRFISAMLLGNTLVNIAASAIATNLLVRFYGAAGVLYATVLMTIILLIFAEVLPKTLAITRPERTALAVAPLAAFFMALFKPTLQAVEGLVRLMLRIFGISTRADPESSTSHEDLKSTVDMMHRDGDVARQDRDMVGGLLDLADLTVTDVMIHRTKMQVIKADQPAGDLVREVLASPYTRLPLWQGEPENIIGVLHAKDLLRALAAARGDTSGLVATAIASKPWFVPDTTSLPDQLQAFLKRKTHFALVVDEYGSVMGLVTLEDILEEIVGDIKDEHDPAAAGVRMLDDGSVTVDGGLPIRDLNRVMDWDLPGGEATTIAGLVIHEARSIPEVGQMFTFHNFRFEVLRKARNRLVLLRVARLAAPDADSDDMKD